MRAGAGRVEWHLYVDESGDFDEAIADVFVAGMLICGSAAERDPSAIRARLEAAAPGVPWPLHFAHLSRLALHVIATDVWGGKAASASASSADSTLRAAMTVLVRLDADRVRRVREALVKGDEPDYDDLRALDDALREADIYLAYELENVLRSAWASVAKVTRDLLRLARPGLPVAIGEGRAGESWVESEDHAPSRRYRALLSGLFRRVCDLLQEIDGRHRVWLHVLSRPYVPRGGTRRQLDRQEMKKIAASFDTRYPERIELLVSEVPFFDAKTSPALVIADFVAHQARRILRNSGFGLAPVEEEFERAIGGSPRLPDPSLSSLAATGALAKLIEDARRRATVELELLVNVALRLWAREQAKEWVEYYSEAGP
jgi:hypothetical protein